MLIIPSSWGSQLGGCLPASPAALCNVILANDECGEGLTDTGGSEHLDDEGDAAAVAAAMQSMGIGELSDGELIVRSKK
jgi:hypothetical protein